MKHILQKYQHLFEDRFKPMFVFISELINAHFKTVDVRASVIVCST